MSRFRIKTVAVEIGFLIVIYLAVLGYGLLMLMIGGGRGIFKGKPRDRADG